MRLFLVNSIREISRTKYWDTVTLHVEILMGSLFINLYAHPSTINYQLSTINAYILYSIHSKYDINKQ